jgi:L-iditol 2-dehydrogenase
MSDYRTSFLTGPRAIELTTAPRPTPAEGEVLIELGSIGVCGSDVHWYLEGGIGSTKLNGPLTLGHEPAGRVVELGPGVDPALAGRRVAIEPAIHCGRCKFCLRGDINLCPSVRFMGTVPTHGAYRELMTHPAHLVAPLPDALDDDMGALLEPLAIAVHVADLLKPRLGANVVIQGAGPIGLSCLIAMRLHGPRRIIVVEPLEYRRRLALEMGADLVFSPDDPDVVAEIKRATAEHGVGYGAEYVIEAVGLPASFDQMVRYAEPGAKIALIGIDPHDRLAFNHSISRRKGLTILMVRRSRNTLHRAMDLTARGLWRPQPLITHSRSLAQLPPTMEMVANYQDGVIKAMIHPNKS